jgi:hypothetical protein
VVDAKSFWATHGQDIEGNAGLTTVPGVSAVTMAATGAAIQTAAAASNDVVKKEQQKDVPAALIGRMIDAESSQILQC